jgi:hypothetical protein
MLDPYQNFLRPLDLPPVEPVELPSLDVPAEAGNDRRDFLRKAGIAGAAAAAATVGGPLLAAPSAFAAESTELSPEARALLPVIGQTIDCDCRAFGATLLVNLPGGIKLDFIGRIRVRVEVGGSNFVRLLILDHTVAASHDMFGKITITLPTVDIGLSQLVANPTGFIQTMLTSLHITFERCGDCEGPFQFESFAPAKLVGNLLTFPPMANAANPKGIPYTLQEPVNLGLPGNKSGDVFVQLKNMVVNVAHPGGTEDKPYTHLITP